MRHLHHRDDGIGTRGDQKVHCGVDMAFAAKRRRRLQQDHDVRSVLFLPIEHSKRIHQHVDHGSVVECQLRRTQKRNVRAVPPGDRSDFFIVRADDDARKRAAETSSFNRVRDERTTSERREILAWNAFRTAPSRNHTKDVQY